MDEPDVRPGAHPRLASDTGANLVEYSLILALIIIVCLAALTVFGRNATNRMSCVSSVITSQATNATC